MAARARDECTVNDEDACATIRLRLVGVTRSEVQVACAPRCVEVRVGGAKPRVFVIDLPGDVADNPVCAFRDGDDSAIALRITVAKVQSGSWTESIRVRRRRVRKSPAARAGEVSEPAPRRPVEDASPSDAELIRRLVDLLSGPVPPPPPRRTGLLGRLRSAVRRVVDAACSVFARFGRAWTRIGWRPAAAAPRTRAISRPPALLLALPEDLLVVALARCPLRDHAALARTCHDFRRIVVAPTFARTRRRLGVAEVVVAISGGRDRPLRWSRTSADTSAGALYYTNGSRRALADLPARRYGAIAGFIGAELVVVGGFLEDNRSTNSCVSRNLRLDAPTTEWRRFPATASPRGNCAGGVVHAPGPRLVVAGGVGQAKQLRQGSLTAPHNVVEAFDPATRRWSRRTPMPVPVCAAASAADGHRLFVVGGQMEERFTACGILQIYDARADTWSLGAPLPVPTWGASATVINGRLVVAGGWLADGARTQASRLCWIYNPSVDAWSQMPPLSDPAAMYTPLPTAIAPDTPYNRLVRAELDRAAADVAANEPRPAPAPGLFHVTTLPWLLDEGGRHPERIFEKSDFRLAAAAAVSEL